MRQPQVLIYETDGLLAKLLRREEPESPWVIREPRRLEACVRLLRRGGPAVLVVRTGRDLLHELGLVERIKWLFPATALVVVADAADARVAALAWDLGADYVLPFPLDRESLSEIIARLLQTAPLHATAAQPEVELAELPEDTE